MADINDKFDGVIKRYVFEEDKEDSPSSNLGAELEKPKQIIYFGAPGTGKSFKVEKEGSEKDRIRTTFHPDSDYSSFVGCYKPLQDPDKPERIIYKFEGQCFAKAYVEAWKRLVCPKEGESKYYTLVIEEINRGNCAQIFGDIFQLLDRDEQGFSQYAIQPDEDLSKYLRDEFERLEIKECLEEHYPKIANGTEMRLPRNLSIIATMNTSDQSLFPIDSAFKRRWDWEYIPIQYKPIDKITNQPKDYKINVDGVIYDWGLFIKAVNGKIYSVTLSEDKQLGYFFATPDEENNTITMERFVHKVIFYLWSDIYKDLASRGDSIFNFSEDETDKKERHSFNSFFNDSGKIITELVQSFIEQFKEVKENASSQYQSQGATTKTRPRYGYKVNNAAPCPGNQIATEAMKIYMNNNPGKSASDIVNDWSVLGLDKVLSHFVETSEFYRSNQVSIGGRDVWVTWHGWTFNKTKSSPIPTIPMLIKAINNQDWGITIEIDE